MMTGGDRFRKCNVVTRPIWELLKAEFDVHDFTVCERCCCTGKLEKEEWCIVFPYDEGILEAYC